MGRNLLVCFLHVVVWIFVLNISSSHVYAAPPVPTVTPTITPTPAPNVTEVSITPTPGVWVEDPNVTFVGKVASRSGSLLDWSLQNYNWMFVPSGATNPLAIFWVTMRNIVFALLILVVLSIAFLIIVTRGKNITVMRFIPQLIFMLILITLSFSLVQFLYQLTDIVQGFFLKSPGNVTQFISQKDLLQINFDYKNFVGYRRFGSEFDESAFMSLLLVKMTAITYYVMIGILLIRKIILWFFLIISPVFAVLIFYYPLRNTSKIWLGEFFRWLLYGPIFAIFLAGVVYVWRSGIPLQFNGFPGAGNEGNIMFPTSVNILLGGPGQQVSLTNSINTPETFAQYLVALLMLWVVMLLPFLLLQIFLDYIHTSLLNQNIPVKQFLNGGYSFFTKPVPNPTPPIVSPPPSYQPFGMARAIPITQKIEMPTIKQQFIAQNSFTRQDIQSFHSQSQSAQSQSHTEVLRLANLSLPTMRDIARFETATLSTKGRDHDEGARIRETLQQIYHPERIQTQTDRQRFLSVKEQLTAHERQGNPMASAVLSAAKSVSQETNIGGTVSSAFIKTSDGPKLPVVNSVQTVNIDDYEAVKKLWHENYQKLNPPQDNKEVQKDRKTWIKEDIENIKHAIDLITTNDPEKVKEGMGIVGKILPFLLIGGFSKTEIITYLKSKLEAAKAVLLELEQKEEEEETVVSVKKEKEENTKVMHAQEELP